MSNPQSAFPLLKRLWSGYVRGYSWLLLIAVVLMSIEGGTLGLLSYQVKPMIDDVFIGADYGAMTQVALVLLALFVARGVSSYGQRTLTVYVGMRVVERLQADLTRHILSLDSSFFHYHSPGALIERVRGDTGALQNTAANALISLGRDAFSLVSLISVTLYIDWLWTLIAFVGAPLLVLPVMSIQKQIRKASRRARAAAAHLSMQLDEIFHGFKAIKANLMEGHEYSRIVERLRGVYRQQFKSERGKAALPTFIDFVAGLGFVGVMVYGGAEIIEGKKTLGDFMSFFAAMALVFDPVRRLVGLGGALNAAVANLERVYELFDKRPTIIDRPQAEGLRDPGGEITFTELWFSYADQPIIRGLNLQVPAGGLTALVGESGAGKTTLLNLLCRFEEPQQGSIRIGGQDIQQVGLADLRGNIALVTQETALFDQSIRDNIAYGDWEASDEAIDRAARQALVKEFADKLPKGLLSPAGPRGSNLSGGQRQRVMLARTLLRNAPILLLDEATSALDSQTEDKIQQALEQVTKGRTTIVIAHRLSTILRADLIHVIDKGQVVESGNHQSLMRQQGAYARLYQQLFKEEKHGGD